MQKKSSISKVMSEMQKARWAKVPKKEKHLVGVRLAQARWKDHIKK